MPPEYVRKRSVGRVGQLELLEQLRRARHDLRRRHLPQDPDHLQVLATREVRVDGGVLTGQADPPPDGGGLLHDVVTQHLCVPTVGLQDGRQDADGGGLAGAVRSQQPEDRSLRHLEVDATQGFELAVVLGQPFDADRDIAHDHEPSHNYLRDVKYRDI